MSTKVINKTENEMGTTPVGRLLFKLSLPIILSVLISSLYNLVDSIFVGRLGDNALTAISLATPINIILDPIMIFGYLGFPAMGMKGAAIATVIGQSCAAIIGLVLNLTWNKEIKFAFNFLKPVGHLIHEIIVIAVPATLTYALNSILAFGMNIILIGYTTVAPAVYIVYTRIQSFIIMPVWGIRNTLVSIVAYNYGAEKKDRVKRAISLSVKTALVVMTIGTLLVEIIPRQLLAAFSDSSEMILIGVPALRVIGITFIISGVTVILNGVFQALGRSDKTFIVSLLQAGSLLLSAVVLGMAHNLTYVWIAFPISEICIYILTKYYYKRISSNLLA